MVQINFFNLNSLSDESQLDLEAREATKRLQFDGSIAQLPNTKLEVNFNASNIEELKLGFLNLDPVKNCKIEDFRNLWRDEQGG